MSGSKGQRSRSQCSDYCFLWCITAFPLHQQSSNFTHRFPVSQEYALLILGLKTWRVLNWLPRGVFVPLGQPHSSFAELWINETKGIATSENVTHIIRFGMVKNILYLFLCSFYTLCYHRKFFVMNILNYWYYYHKNDGIIIAHCCHTHYNFKLSDAYVVICKTPNVLLQQHTCFDDHNTLLHTPNSLMTN